MARAWRFALFAVVLAGLVLAPLPAPAHPDGDHPEEEHPGRYIPSPESSSKNLHLLSSVDKTTTDPTYRNSDLAFWGRLAFAGNYLGFRIIDVSDPEAPVTVADVSCPGSQHDVSVWGHLLFLSMDTPRSAPTCDSSALPSSVNGFEGIRVFDVSDPANPRYVTGVPTDCGSHTHTLLPDLANGRVLLYVSSYPASHLGPTPFGTKCERLTATGEQGHAKISIVGVPLDRPHDAAVVAEPGVVLKDRNNVPGYRGCHDITVFTGIARAAAACLNEGQIWDISDPLNPRTLARVHNPNVDIWHSAAFTWDGKVVVFGDEAGGGGAPRCRDRDPATLGAAWFYRLSDLDVMDGTTVEPALGSFKIPRNQGDAANCTMHNFNVIPVTGRYVLVSANYAGGTSVADFTDPAKPVEIAHLDPHGANTWSTYWYNNFIYSNDSGRGVDVMLLSDKARAGARKFAYLNPQTQEGLLR